MQSDLSLVITISQIATTFLQFLLAIHKDKRSVSSSLTPIYKDSKCESFDGTRIKRHAERARACAHIKRNTMWVLPWHSHPLEMVYHFFRGTHIETHAAWVLSSHLHGERRIVTPSVALTSRDSRRQSFHSTHIQRDAVWVLSWYPD